MTAERPDGPLPSTLDYIAIERSEQFLELKRRHARFVFPLAAFFLAWYFGFVLLAAYAPEIMAIPVFGLINLGLVLGFAQVATTFTITMWYVSFANRRLDPLSLALRTKFEKEERLLTEADQLDSARPAGAAQA